jgi:hypothetical protein
LVVALDANEASENLTPGDFYFAAIATPFLGAQFDNPQIDLSKLKSVRIKGYITGSVMVHIESHNTTNHAHWGWAIGEGFNSGRSVLDVELFVADMVVPAWGTPDVSKEEALSYASAFSFHLNTEKDTRAELIIESIYFVFENESDIPDEFKPFCDWDYGWRPITIRNEEDLRRFATMVNNGNDFAGRTITLANDINIESGNWVGIGRVFFGDFSGTFLFNGTFDGNNKTIGGIRNQGLFRYLGHDGVIKNLGVEVDVAINAHTAGGLVDINNGRIVNCRVSGNLLISEWSFGWLGGLVGYNAGVIENSSTYGTVSGSSDIGGLVSHNSGTIKNSSAKNNVVGGNDGFNVGGLVGINFGVIYGSNASGTVDGGNSIGGLVGNNHENGIIVNSFASGDVKGAGNSVGGLVGYNLGTVERSSASGNVFGVKDVGGLVGWNIVIVERFSTLGIGRIINSHASGEVNGIDYVGGLVGDNYGESTIIKNSFATGGVSATGAFIGGLAGENSGTIENSYSLENMSYLFVGNNLDNGTYCSNSGARTATQLRRESNFITWDFGGIWAIVPEINEGFPHLQSDNNNETSIRGNQRPRDARFGILLENVVVSDIARISVITPELSQINLKNFDALGNVIIDKNGRNTDIFVWDLRNNAGRFVASGTYLLIVEATGISGRIHRYQARIGVRR